MEKRILDELNLLKDIILKTLPVEQILLFGSHSEGKPTADSDLDILVVMPENASIRETDAIKLIHKEIGDKKSVPVDVIVIKSDKFNRRKATPTMESQIAEKGVVLYG